LPRNAYGRPLPTGEATARPALAESVTNRAQRERILRRLEATMEEHYPYLLRPEVSADVTITFKVVRGTIQEDVYVGIVRQYRHQEE
jgi:hypothetical protein